MAKRYIQNCTGDECEKRGTLKGRRSFSVLILKIIFYILLVAFICVSTYILFFSSHLKILNVEITGTQEISSDEIRQKIELSLKEKYVGIIPKSNFLFVSQKKIEGFLMNDFKKIRSVSVKKKFPDSISVNIDERKALLVWCSVEKCFLLDENGTAYNEADFNSPEFIQNHLLQIRDMSGREISIGENIINSAYEKYALDARDALLKMGFESSGEYVTPSRMAEEIRIKTSQGTELYFSIQFSLESAISTLDTILKKEISFEKIGDVEYIDLRDENKVFYKFKSLEPVTENKDSNSNE